MATYRSTVVLVLDESEIMVRIMCVLFLSAETNTWDPNSPHHEGKKERRVGFSVSRDNVAGVNIGHVIAMQVIGHISVDVDSLREVEESIHKCKWEARPHRETKDSSRDQEPLK